MADQGLVTAAQGDADVAAQEMPAFGSVAASADRAYVTAARNALLDFP